MNIIIEVIMRNAGSRILRAGTFEVNTVDFKKEADWTAAVSAYQFIQQIKIETSYNIVIEKVTYNVGIDITELVKKVRPVIQEDLPF